MQKSKTIIVNESELVREVAQDFKGVCNKNVVRSVFDAIEHHISENLMALNENHDSIQIKLFPGLSVYGRYEAAKTKRAFGQNMVIPEQIKVRSAITKCFVRSLNSEKFRRNEK